MVLGHLLREAHAAVAEDAALAVDRHERRQLERLLEVALGLDEARAPGAPAERDVLQRALAALVADRAVERVVHEQELDDRVLRVLHAVRGRSPRPCRRAPAWSTRSAASGCPRSRPGTCGRRRPAGRASARNRSRGSRRRRAWRRRRASRPPARAPACRRSRSVIQFCSGRAICQAAPASGTAASSGRERRSSSRSRRLRAVLHVLLELLAEVLQHRGDRHRHRVAQHAQAVADDVALDLARAGRGPSACPRPRRCARASSRSSSCPRGTARTCRTTRAGRTRRAAAPAARAARSRRRRSSTPCPASSPASAIAS